MGSATGSEGGAADGAGERALVDAVLAGDADAWARFFARHAGDVGRLVRTSASMGSLARSEDDRRNVLARVFERLRRDDHRALRLYLRWQADHPERSFAAWLAVVTTNVIRDYVSSRLGEGAQRRLLDDWPEELPDDSPTLAVLPHITTLQTARQLIEHARAHLPPGQAACLAAWLEGNDFAEVARAAGLADARTAEKAVRAALARLRRHAGRQP